MPDRNRSGSFNESAANPDPDAEIEMHRQELAARELQQRADEARRAAQERKNR